MRLQLAIFNRDRSASDRAGRCNRHARCTAAFSEVRQLFLEGLAVSGAAGFHGTFTKEAGGCARLVGRFAAAREN